MASDPDAMWKPGFDPDAAADPPNVVADGTGDARSDAADQPDAGVTADADQPTGAAVPPAAADSTATEPLTAGERATAGDRAADRDGATAADRAIAGDGAAVADGAAIGADPTGADLPAVDHAARADVSTSVDHPAAVPGPTGADDDHGGGTYGTADPMSTTGSTSIGRLPDRFRPAVEPRATVVVPPPSSEDPPDPADAPAVGPQVVVPDGWVLESDEEPPPVAAPRSRRRFVVGVAAAAVLAMVAVAVVGVLTDDPDPRRPEPEEISGADTRRLPAEVDELWSTRLPGTGAAAASSLTVDGRELVVAVVDDGSRNRSSVIAVDGRLGSVRWRRSFTFAPPEVRVLGVVGGVVVLEQNDISRRRLFGLSGVDGTTLWERETIGPGANTVLLGTDLVTNVSSDGVDQLSFVDPQSGDVAGQFVGQLLSTDLTGTWYASRGSNLLSIDLADGWSEPELVADEGPPGDLMVVVDGRVVVADAFGRLSELRGDGGPRSLNVVGGSDLPRITSMFPAGGSSFVGVGRGKIFGAELIDDSVSVTWTRDASLRSFALTERGLVLSVSDAGLGFVDGADLLIVDAISGDRISGLPAVADSNDMPIIVGDGFVGVIDADEGARRIGYDLDGTRMWELAVTGKVRVGEDIVAVLTNTPSGYVITAYGETV